MSPRPVYVRSLSQLPPPEALALPGVAIGQPAPADAAALAALMLDAYRGTIDYDGETLAEARAEVEGYFSSTTAPALLGQSRVCWQGELAVSAVLVSEWPARGCPLIAFVMTRAAWKAQRLVLLSLHSLAAAGYHEIRAVITEGNAPSERVFARLGFAREPGQPAG